MSTAAALQLLRDELQDARQLHGRRSGKAAAAFNRLFRYAASIDHPLDGLRRYSENETERFFSRTIQGPDGHVYWDGGQVFRRNDGSTVKPRRWWWQHLHGPIARCLDVNVICGERNCINPEHCSSGRIRERWYSDRAAIGSLQVVAMRLGHSPTMRQWDAGKYTPSTTTLKRRFGAWPQVLAAAGLPSPPPPENPGQFPKGNREDCLRALLLCRDLFGHFAHQGEFRSERAQAALREAGLPTAVQTIKRHLGDGSWKVAVHRAQVARDSQIEG